MSTIPPNNASILGSVLQSQNSAAEVSRARDARRNQRAQEARAMARLSEKKQEEVEDAEHVDELVVRREDERQRDGQDARDTYEQHEKNNADKPLYTSEQSDGPPSQDGQGTPDDQKEKLDEQPHIDFSA